jgi:hypothetical protein
VDKRSAEIIGAGSSAAAICGLAAAILSIVGLAGMMPLPLCCVAAIVAGAGMTIQGGAVAARFKQIEESIAAVEGQTGRVTVETGITVEVVGGVAAIVLGILALLHMAPFTLVATSAIVLGATILLGSGSTFDTVELASADPVTASTMRPKRRAAASAAGIDILMGIAAVTLGILNIIGIGGHFNPMLSLVALLVVGIAELLTDATLAARMMSIFRHS